MPETLTPILQHLNLSDQMFLLMLPTELVLLLLLFLEEQKDISSLSRTCVRLHTILSPWLYRNNARNLGSSALLWAAKNGNEATAHHLILGGANISITDDIGLTPLSYTAAKGHESIVHLLMQTEKANADSVGLRGWTPLFWAAENGQEAVVKLLLQTETVSIDSKDF
ncbi:hypothetical protein AAEP93_004949 [Penicillium crustosum]